MINLPQLRIFLYSCILNICSFYKTLPDRKMHEKTFYHKHVGDEDENGDRNFREKPQAHIENYGIFKFN